MCLSGPFGAEVEGELAGDLDGVGVEEGSGGVGDGGEFGDGLDDAGLVVGVHDADEFCVGAEGGLEGGGLDEAFGGGGEEGDFDAGFSRDSAAWRTAWCSMVVVMRCAGAVWLERMPKRARLSLSVPPEVKTISELRQWRKRAMAVRACSTAPRACWPCWWMELALP